MWFRLSLLANSHPLAAVVGKDGQLYWRTVDLAKLIQIHSVYKFIQRHGQNIHGHEVMIGTHSIQNLRMNVCDTEHAYQLLRRYDLGDLFKHALEKGVGVVTIVERKIVDSYKQSPILSLGGGDVSLKEWIDQFVADYTWYWRALDFPSMFPNTRFHKTEPEMTEIVTEPAMDLSTEPTTEPAAEPPAEPTTDMADLLTPELVMDLEEQESSLPPNTLGQLEDEENSEEPDTMDIVLNANRDVGRFPLRIRIHVGEDVLVFNRPA